MVLLAVIIFYDRQGTDEPFVPFDADAVGAIPQVFFVVEEVAREPLSYALSFFQRHAIGTYAPQTPPSSYSALDFIYSLYG